MRKPKLREVVYLALVSCTVQCHSQDVTQGCPLRACVLFTQVCTGLYSLQSILTHVIVFAEQSIPQ